MERDCGASLADWLKVVRRARMGRTVKAVAYAVATRANNDGTRIFPGIARLSVECELSPKVVKEALRALREGGLLELVKAATVRGEASEYRLILGPQVLDAFEVPTPAAHDLEVERVAASLRGKWRGTPNLRGTGDPAGSGAGGDLRGTADPAGDTPAGAPAGYGADDKSEPAGYGATDLRGTPYPATSPIPLRVTTSPSDEQARTAVTGPRVREAEQQISTSGEGGGSGRPARPPLGSAERKAAAAVRERGETWAEQIERLRRERSTPPPQPLDFEQAMAERRQRIGDDGDALVGSLLATRGA